jgi:hypothetical protein
VPFVTCYPTAQHQSYRCPSRRRLDVRCILSASPPRATSRAPLRAPCNAWSSSVFPAPYRAADGKGEARGRRRPSAVRPGMRAVAFNAAWRARRARAPPRPQGPPSPRGRSPGRPARPRAAGCRSSRSSRASQLSAPPVPPRRAFPARDRPSPLRSQRWPDRSGRRTILTSADCRPRTDRAAVKGTFSGPR